MNTPAWAAPAPAAALPLSARRDAWAAVVLVLLVAWMHRHLPQGFLGTDDPAILLHALTSPGLRAFHDAHDWRQLSPANLTPWLTLSFKVDLWLGGIDPAFFYKHQIASLMALALALYALSRQWLPPLWGLGAVLLFLVGAPTASVAQALATRHYLEGAILASLALLAFVHAARTHSSIHSMRWAWAGAAAYALATTAKEVYVPLVLLLLVIPAPVDFRQRLRRMAPFVGVAVLYVFWRRAMLGSTVGGYGADVMSAQSVQQIWQAFSSFPDFLFGPLWLIPTAMLASVLAVFLGSRPWAWPLALVLVLTVLVPLVPLVHFPGITGPDRYLFVVWLVLALAGTLALKAVLESRAFPRWQQWGLAALPGPLLGLFAVTHTLVVGRDLATMRQEVHTQGRFILDAVPSQGLVPTESLLANYWYVMALCQIKKTYLAKDCPVMVVRGQGLDQAIQHLHRYDRNRSGLVDLTAQMQTELDRLAFIDTTRPLKASLQLDTHGVVRWRLGPYPQGAYFAVSPSIGRYPVAQEGDLKIGARELRLQIQFDSPEGWSTTSPLLTVAPGKPVVWSRAATP